MTGDQAECLIGRKMIPIRFNFASIETLFDSKKALLIKEHLRTQLRHEIPILVELRQMIFLQTF